MRRLFFILVLSFASLALRAQEEDTIFRDESYNDSATYEESVQDDEYNSSEEDEETEAVAKTLVSPEKLTEDYRSQPLTIKKFDDKKWKEVVGETDFNEKPEEKEKEKEKQPLQIQRWDGAILQPIAYVLMIAIIIALLYFVIRNTTFEARLKKSTIQHDDASQPIENIEELDIHALLQQALAQGNYRLAVRLYYLSLLKSLNQVGLITWKKDKTNREYLTELFSKDQYFDDVRKLTLAYEQVWYGEHAITQESFQQLTVRFETVNQKLNNIELS
jgi:hypothetical protein